MSEGHKLLSENRKARFDYEITEHLEAGVVLTGSETKSAKNGHFLLPGSRVIVRGKEAYLVGSEIPPYQAKNTDPQYQLDRTRKLILKKSQIIELEKFLETKGFSAIPLSAYAKRGLVKLEIGLGRGRKAADKRAHLKEKSARREMRQEVDR